MNISTNNLILVTKVPKGTNTTTRVYVVSQEIQSTDMMVWGTDIVNKIDDPKWVSMHLLISLARVKVPYIY